MKWTIPEKIIERGRAYADDSRVVSISQDVEQEVWYADVIGSEIYHVELDGTAKEEDICTCPYWLDHGYCKHTVAVELALRTKGYSRIMKANRQLKTNHQPPALSKMFTDSFSKLQEKETKQGLQIKTPLRLEIYLESLETFAFHPEKSTIGISLKVGEKTSGSRTYVVKNVADFLLAYEKQQRFRVNDNNTYSLQVANFSQEDQEILAFCLEIYHSNQMVATNGVQVKGKLNPRYMLLPFGDAKALIERLNKKERLNFKVAEENLAYVQFTKGDLPIIFHVNPYRDGYLLKIESHVKMYWEAYQWVLGRNTIVEVTHQQQEVYVMLQQLLKRVEVPEIFYAKEDVADLFAYVVPSLESIGKVIVADSLQSEMIQAPLKTHLHLSVEQKKIAMRVDFHYADVVFSSDEKLSSPVDKTELVVRNQIQENRLLAILNHYHYIKGKIDYRKPLPLHGELFAFFTEELPFLRKIAEVSLATSLSSLFLDSVQHQPSIEVREEGSWLDVRFDISDIPEEEIDAVVLSLINKEDFHELKNGQILSLESEMFQRTSEALMQLRGSLNYRNGSFEAPKYRGLQIESALNELTTTTFSQDFKEMVSNLTHPEKFQADLPKGLDATLREYQIDGFKWLKMLSQYRFGGILADDMGLGKTIQTITYLLSEKEEGNAKGPAIIVAPASLIYNWQMECQKFAPSLKTIVVSGPKNEREALLETGMNQDVIVTSYASVRQDIELYEEFDIQCLILDEAQMVKNSATKTFQAIKDLKTNLRFALSGTPIENNLEELWALFQMLMPGFFPSKKRFKAIPVEEIARMIQPFVLRREKREVLKDLPDKIESNLYSVLTEEQKTVYLAYLKQMQNTLNGMDHDAFNKNRISILAGLTRLRQICCDPSLFLEDYQGQSGKLEQLKELLQAAKQNNRRVLVFSQFTSMLSKIEEELERLELDTFYLRGSTKPKERMEMVEAFNSGEKDVFLISLKAGGTGLNLTGADTVILYDLWWNPAVEEQAAGRAHRIGQKKVVEVWRLIAEGTIEEKMNQLQQEKKELFNRVMNADEEQQLAKLTEDDIREILNIGIE